LENQIIKVSAHSGASAAAGAIAALIREKGEAEIQVVGAGALNQAVKAVILARGYLAPEGKEIYMLPSFASTTINGDERTAIRLEIKTR